MGDRAATTEQRYLSSTVAAYASQLARTAIAFGARLLLARLVDDHGHGLFALALRIVTVVSACRDLGLAYHLMRDERRPYGTVLLSIGSLGLALSLGVFLAAPLAARLTPELPPVLRVLAVWILLDGLAVVPRTYFERELQIGRLLAPEIGRGVVMAVVSVGLAEARFGVWSLVLGELAGVLVYAPWLWLRARGRMPLQVEPRLLPELYRRSAWLFLVWVAVQLVTYIDIYIVEGFRDTGQVGQYERAYWVAFLTWMVVTPRALLPALVAYAGDAARFVGAFRIATAAVMGAQALTGYFLLLNAEKTVWILLGPGWEPAVPVLRTLSFAPFLDAFGRMGGEMLKVRNEDRVWLATVLLNLASLAGFGIAFTARWGIVGMAAANYLLLGSALLAWRVAAICGPAARALAADVAFVLLAPLPAFAAAALASPASWLRFSLSAAAAAAGAALFARRFRAPFREFFGRS